MACVLYLLPPRITAFSIGIVTVILSSVVAFVGYVTGETPSKTVTGNANTIEIAINAIFHVTFFPLHSVTIRIIVCTSIRNIATGAKIKTAIFHA
ncbi:hypothetical protein [Faecalimicrobium sp. JNUCC 81]